MRAISVIRPNPERPGYYHLYVPGNPVPKVACSDQEALSRAIHAVAFNGGSVWLLDTQGYPHFSMTVPASGDTGLRGAGVTFAETGNQ